MNYKNPFQTENPVAEPRSFYGRREEVSKIYARIGASRPQNISVVGGKKMGKSSLVRFLTHPQTKAENLQDPQTYLFFLMHIREVGELNPDKFFQHVASWWHTEKGSEFEPSYDGLKKAIESSHQKEEKIIFFLDDFEVITQNPAFPLQFFSFLRSMANNYNVAYITTSYEELQKLCISKEVGESPFFNIFANLPLRAMKESEAKQLIIENSAKEGVSLLEEADFIIEIAGCFPLTLQSACRLLFELKAEPGKLKKADLDSVKERFVAEIRPYYEALWGELSEAEQLVCKKIFSGDNIERREEYLVRELGRKDYIVQKDGKYDFFASSFKSFVGKQFGIETKEEGERKGLFSFLKRK